MASGGEPRTNDPIEAETLQSELVLGEDQQVYEAALPRPRRAGRRWLASLPFGLVAIAWIGLVAWGLAATAADLNPLEIARWIGFACGPLALLALLWLILLRTGRVETGRYTTAAGQLRTESLRLAEVLSLVGHRMTSAREMLGAQVDALSHAGEEAGARFARAGEALRAQAGEVARTAQALDDATASARTDMGVLLADLPQARARAAELSEQLRQAGEQTNRNVELLGERLDGLQAQAAAVDQGSTTAARRLAIEIERIETSLAVVDRRMSEAAGRLESASTGALDNAAGTLDQVRRVIEEQGAAVTALLAHGHDSFREVGEESAKLLNERLEGLQARFDAVGGRLRAHESQSRGLLVQLDQSLASIEARFNALERQGTDQAGALGEALAALSEGAEQVGHALGQDHAAAEGLIARIAALRNQLAAGHGELTETLPTALAQLREQVDSGLAAIAQGSPGVAKMAADAERAATYWHQAGAVLARHGEATIALTNQAQALQVLLARIDASFNIIAEGASTKLVDALLRVRETAAQAAANAREAITQAVPEAANALAEASAREMALRLRDVGRAEIQAVGTASQQAADAARAASERLNRQLMVLAETTQALEARLAEHRRSVDADNEDSFARQISLLIEALNSTAIDVSKLLSREPSDTEWSAYLKGDRGIFTRRVVRLLDSGEAKSVAQRYGVDGGFHELVNRYIHDFEAMLRRVLSMREGGTMGVTLLSSDAGKLYVALAQSIERLRR
jgi:hypothetical protein